MKRALIAAATLLLVAAGCGDSDDEGVPPKADVRHGFVAKVNDLCGKLEQDVLAVVKDNRFPTAEEYLAIERQVAPLRTAFDAEVDAIDVADADEAVAKAFDAYRSESDAAAAKLTAAASSGEESAYQAAFAANDQAYEASTTVPALTKAGISCQAR